MDNEPPPPPPPVLKLELEQQQQPLTIENYQELEGGGVPIVTEQVKIKVGGGDGRHQENVASLEVLLT